MLEVFCYKQYLPTQMRKNVEKGKKWTIFGYNLTGFDFTRQCQMQKL